MCRSYHPRHSASVTCFPRGLTPLCLFLFIIIHLVLIIDIDHILHGQIPYPTGHIPRNLVFHLARRWSEMDITLDSLPDEVIRMILVHLSPFTTIALQTTCKRFLDIGHEPLLWKSYCQDAFRWWGQDWHYSELHTDASFIDWRGAFANRHSESRQVTKALDNIIANETGRLDGIEEILKIGYNAKDTLMHLYQSSPSSSNHLAQR